MLIKEFKGVGGGMVLKTENKKICVGYGYRIKIQTNIRFLLGKND